MSHSKFSSIPKHVGLIPDGARRWARLHNKPLLDTYIGMMEIVNNFTDFMFQNGSEMASLYLLSRDNLKRPDHELNPVLEAESKFFDEIVRPTVEKYKARVYPAGSLDILPEGFRKSLLKLCNESYHFSERKIYILAGYSPFDEINAALVEANGREIGLSNLWVKDPLDLIVRTSGENRISNFLPLQASYAELVFLPNYLNDMTQQDMEFALEAYQKRARRFGS